MRKQLENTNRVQESVEQLDSRLDAIIIRLKGVTDDRLRNRRGPEEGHRTEGEGKK